MGVTCNYVLDQDVVGGRAVVREDAESRLVPVYAVGRRGEADAAVADIPHPAPSVEFGRALPGRYSLVNRASSQLFLHTCN